MDFLAAAKMKATTTVTLFITFLIAVGCSSAEVNAPSYDKVELVLENEKLRSYITTEKPLDWSKNKLNIKIRELDELLGASGTLYFNPQHPLDPHQPHPKPGQYISITGVIATIAKHEPKQPKKLVITDVESLDSHTTSLIFKNNNDDDGLHSLHSLQGQSILIQGKVKLVPTIRGGVRFVDITKVAIMESMESKEEEEAPEAPVVLAEVEVEVEDPSPGAPELCYSQELQKYLAENLDKINIKASQSAPARSSWISAGIFSLTILLAGAVALISWTLQKKTKAHCKESLFSQKMK